MSAALLTRAHDAFLGLETASQADRVVAYGARHNWRNSNHHFYCLRLVVILTAVLCPSLSTTALFLMFIDYLIARGPLTRVVLRFFPLDPKKNRAREARKICGQVAARFMGAVFLFTMLPHAFRVLSDEQLRKDKLYATNDDSTSMIIYAAGYFVYDIYISVVRYSDTGAEFLLHAVLCAFAYGYPIVSGALHYVGAGFLMWELSTPLLYLRWVLLKTGRAETRLMTLVNIAFALVFLGCRVIYGPIMSVDFWVSTTEELASPRPGGIPPAVIYSYRIACVALNSLNYYWFSQMVKAFLKKDTNSKDKAR